MNGLLKEYIISITVNSRHRSDQYSENEMNILISENDVLISK